MNYRELGNTGLKVSEIGLGGEWLERHNEAEVTEIIRHCETVGINMLDCWMSEPKVRTNIGIGIKGHRDRWIIQGHIGSTWQNGQYVRTRNLDKTKEAFNDMLTRFDTDYIDLGMIHYVDDIEEFKTIIEGEFLQYVKGLRDAGKIRHIGLSTHNPDVAREAALSDEVEMIMFSINPAFDMMPPITDIDEYFADEYDEDLEGLDSDRAELYKICESKGVGITVMKGYAGGRLFDAKTSPFGVALTPVQCIHYALTRPAVSSIMVGFDTNKQVNEAVSYETASLEEKDYASVLASAPKYAYYGQCTYCGHCAPCPMNIDIAMVNKLYDLAVMQTEVPESIKAHHNELSANAHDCIGCGSCESRCPFGVKIVDKMNKAKELFAE